MIYELKKHSRQATKFCGHKPNSVRACNVTIDVIQATLNTTFLSQIRREGEKAGTNYQGPAVRGWTRGPFMLHIFLSSSVVLILIISDQVQDTLLPTDSLSDLV